MKIELLFIIITGLVVYNIYHENKYIKLLLKYKKYYQIVLIILGSLFLYIMIKRNPKQSKNMLITANNMIKYMPIDKNTSNFLNPLFNYSTNTNSNNYNSNNISYQMKNLLSNNSSNINNFQNQYQSLSQNLNQNQNQNQYENKNKSTKRSVSETKKKYVAYLQDWNCAKCNNRLNHTFEVDHKIRLEHGGGNEVSNLVALCRECHGRKTAFENM